MKKAKIAVAITLILIFAFSLTGCFYTIEHHSLDEYKAQIARSKIGYSDFETDLPDYFLPSLTFLDDYTYLDGQFHFYEEPPWGADKPDRTFLWLKYDEETYLEAKECVLNSIPVFNDKYYFYGDYLFYVNGNFQKTIGGPTIPEWFTMVCYNDTNNTICFLGFCNAYPKLDDKYMNDLDNNWESFIDTYFGEYYDFSQ